MRKLTYYTNFWLKYLTKSFDVKIPSENYLKKYKTDIDYYCKINNPFKLQDSIKLKDVNVLKNSGYSYDLYNILYPFKENLKFKFIAGDVTTVPPYPAFVKSRPIQGDNQNSVLLPLDSNRHFRFVKDKIGFPDKKNGIVWRGAAYQEHRLRFLEKCSKMDFIDAGNTAKSKSEEIPFAKPRLSIKDQLNYKFILSLEGNDVATNLKWIMSSNSVCIMPRPKFETWFKEGKLIPNYHFIEIKDDFSDIEEIYNIYKHNDDLCNQIINNANEYVSKFLCSKDILYLSRSVSLKYLNFIK